MSKSGISTEPGPSGTLKTRGLPQDDAVYVAYLRSKTPEQLRDLAVAAIAAERETGTIAPRLARGGRTVAPQGRPNWKRGPSGGMGQQVPPAPF